VPAELTGAFGRYQIVSKLGEGGMGAVYLAEDTLLHRRVALKVPQFTDGEGFEAVERFYREARAAAGLDHPNLCPVFDVGQVDGVHFLTMPFIEGKTLERLIGEGRPMPQRQAADLARKLALALQVAHARGVDAPGRGHRAP
jgi:serine/threonine protein kinase